MKFYINPGDGSGGRITNKITFANREGTSHVMTADHRGFGVIGFDKSVEGVDDVDTAALHVAELLHRCRDESLVAHTFGGTLRGNEDSTADVYPPGRQPRIHVER